MTFRDLGLVVLVALCTLPTARTATAQQTDVMDVAAPDGSSRSVRVRRDNGFAAAWVGALTAWGWDVEAEADSVTLVHISRARLVLRAGVPYARYGGGVMQLTDAPYLADDSLFVPVQVFSEVARGVGPGDHGAGPAPSVGPDNVPRPVIVIDAGHGGRDLGTIGYGGTREKDIALDVAGLLAGRLKDRGFDVFLLRDTDVYIPVWDRGRTATALKGEAAGVLVSLHVNANPNSRDVRGVETYFLADARTEHERRLAELESQVPGAGDGETLPGEDLSHILSELRNLDYQRWSARLADLVHRHVVSVHPGPDLGVRQAPLAVLTNALMPAILVEIGYITNGPEEQLLKRPDFQADVAAAVAEAVESFLAIYPPAQRGPVVGRPQ